MTTVHIEDSTPEGRWLLDLIKDHKSVTVEPEKKEAKTVGACPCRGCRAPRRVQRKIRRQNPRSIQAIMREVIVSPTVLGKLSDLVSYLRDDIKLSEEAAQAYRGQFVQFIMTCSAEINPPLGLFKRWCKLGYRCAVFEKHWVLAYQILDEGIIIQDMCHTAILKE